VFNTRQDQTLFHRIANGRKLFRSMIASRSAREKLRPGQRRRFFGVSQKADEHLITLRLLLQFDNVTVRTPQFSQLAKATKDKKRGTDGGADRGDLDLFTTEARGLRSISFSTISIFELASCFESASKSWPRASGRATIKIASEAASNHTIFMLGSPRTTFSIHLDLTGHTRA
jgi:hypothetical protein